MALTPRRCHLRSYIDCRGPGGVLLPLLLLLCAAMVPDPRGSAARTLRPSRQSLFEHQNTRPSPRPCVRPSIDEWRACSRAPSAAPGGRAVTPESGVGQTR